MKNFELLKNKIWGIAFGVLVFLTCSSVNASVVATKYPEYAMMINGIEYIPELTYYDDEVVYYMPNNYVPKNKGIYNAIYLAKTKEEQIAAGMLILENYAVENAYGVSYLHLPSEMRNIKNDLSSRANAYKTSKELSYDVPIDKPFILDGIDANEVKITNYYDGISFNKVVDRYEVKVIYNNTFEYKITNLKDTLDYTTYDIDGNMYVKVNSPYVNGGTLRIYGNTFYHTIDTMDDEHGKIEVQNYAHASESVLFLTNVQEGYKIDDITVKCLDNTFSVKDMAHFSMPNCDVLLSIKTEPINYKINKENDLEELLRVSYIGHFNNKINLEYDKNSKIEEIIVKDVFGNPIEIVDNYFIMPSSDVFVNVKYKEKLNEDKIDNNLQNEITDEDKKDDLNTSEIEDDKNVETKEDIIKDEFDKKEDDVKEEIKDVKTYSITVENLKGISFSVVDKATYNSQVTFNFRLDDYYSLDKIYLNGKEIDFSDKKFLMPNEDVHITFKLKRFYDIKYDEIKNIEFKIPSIGFPGETINYSYQTSKDNIKLIGIYVNGKYLDYLENKSFIMPEENVKISFRYTLGSVGVLNKEQEILDNDNDLEILDNINYEDYEEFIGIPNTLEDMTFLWLFIIFFGGYLLVKKYIINRYNCFTV